MQKYKTKKGYHCHHIIPKHMGGTNDPKNLKYVTIEEHALEHLKLYEKYGKREDLVAYYLLSGNAKAGGIELSRLGGLKGGKKNRKTGHIQRISKALTHEQRVERGRKGAEVCRELQKNAFFDPNLRLKICTKGGQVQGKINAQNGHLKRISQNYWDQVKAGIKIRNKKIWIYSNIHKQSKQILATESIPEGYIKGRKIKW